MSRHHFSIHVDIDDEVLAEHDGENAPPSNDPDEWNGSDILLALELGIAEEIEVDYYGGPVTDGR